MQSKYIKPACSFCTSILHIYLLRLVASHVTVAKGVHNVLIHILNSLKLQNNLVTSLYCHSLCCQDSVCFLLTDYHPPQFFFLFWVGSWYHWQALQLLISRQLDLYPDFLVVHVDQFGRQIHQWVPVAGIGDLFNVLPFEQRLSFIIFHVHEVANGFETSFLLDCLGEFFVHDLEEGGVSDPNALDDHLAELHGQYDGFEESQGGNDVDKWMDELENDGQNLI